MRITVAGNKSKNELNYYVWKDAIDNNLIDYIPEVFRKNFFYYLWRPLHRLAFSQHVCKVLPSITKIQDFVENAKIKNLFVCDIPNDSKFVIISGATISQFGRKKLKALKKNGCKIILFLHDPIKGINNKARIKTIRTCRASGVIDYVYSFDKDDCAKYGYSYVGQVYTPPFKQQTAKATSDIYFAGRDKGRYDTLYNIVSKLARDGRSCFVRMPEANESKNTQLSKLLEDNFQTSMIPYDKSVKEMIGSSCILDIVQEGQEGISWRIIEAIYYNKKLLTNNKSILKNKYYNPEYMQYFKDVKDIDFDWVQKPVKVNHHYENDYSAIKFIKELDRLS